MDRRYNPQPQSGRNPSDKNTPPPQMRQGRAGGISPSSPPPQYGQSRGGRNSHTSSQPQARQGGNIGNSHPSPSRRSGLGGKCPPTARSYTEYGKRQQPQRNQNQHNQAPHQQHDYEEPQRHHQASPKREKRKNPILGFIPPTIYNSETHKILGFLSSEDLLLVALILIMLDSEDDCGEPFLVYALIYLLLDFDLSDFLPL